MPPLAGLVCNAGLQNPSTPRRSVDGFETTFAVNHLGHFLLANLLLPVLVERGRITVVSSGVHDPAQKTGMPAPRLVTAQAAADDVVETGGEAGRRRYATSELCNVLCVYELARRLGQADDPRLRSIRVNAFDPGLMPGTGLARDYPLPLRLVWHYVMPLLGPFVANVHSTATSGRRLAALAAGGDAATGTYVSDGRPTRSSIQSYDTTQARAPWDASAAMVGIGPDLGA